MPSDFDKKTYKEKKDLLLNGIPFLTKRGQEITVRAKKIAVPKPFDAKDIKALITGFVAYFNGIEQKRKVALGKIQPYGNTFQNNIKLQSGLNEEGTTT